MDTETHSFHDIKAQLETSFLGNRMLYWVKNIHTLDAATRKAWLSYVQTYEGPHTLLYWSSDHKIVAKEEVLVIELPDYCSLALYIALYRSFYPSLGCDTTFVTHLFEQSSTMTLDEACLVMGYQSVIGKKHDTFFAQWLSKLIIPEKSLFLLSQYLFARQSKLFLQHWKSLKADFPDEFWVAYWSEQMWQAALFIMRARKDGYDVARKAAYKLPFSFMNKDWQKYTQESLIQAHQFLWKLDHRLKNSAGTCGLELWYSLFLHNKSF